MFSIREPLSLLHLYAIPHNVICYGTLNVIYAKIAGKSRKMQQNVVLIIYIILLYEILEHKKLLILDY